MGAKKQHAEEKAEALWLISFSDCMSLLMAFFIMLLTFSSFDDVELQKMAGMFNYQSNYSIFPIPREGKDGVMPTRDRVVDTTAEGSETPTDSTNGMLKNPKQLSIVLDEDAYKDRKTFYIPSHWLFWGRGTAFTQDGIGHLRTLAGFMRMAPSRVVIGETGPDGRPGDGLDVRIDRAVAVMQVLTDQMKVPADQFGITASPMAIPARLKGYRVVTIALIARKVQ
jgi:hypothetical protein